MTVQLQLDAKDRIVVAAVIVRLKDHLLGAPSPSWDVKAPALAAWIQLTGHYPRVRIGVARSDDELVCGMPNVDRDPAPGVNGHEALRRNWKPGGLCTDPAAI
jgi:hypothetical protein